MNAELAVLVSVATHGTAWLRSPAGEVGVDGPDGVVAWLAARRAEGVDRLWLAVAPGGGDGGGRPAPHVAAAFAGAGSWLLLSTGAVAPATWWRVEWDGGAAAFHGLAQHGAVPDRTGVAAAAGVLRACLAEAHQFAAARDLSPWDDVFADALALVDDGGEPATFDLFPPAWPGDAARLGAGAAAAWVFGGMGSWNDLGFSEDADQSRYQALSAVLYRAVLTALVAAVNADAR